MHTDTKRVVNTVQSGAATIVDSLKRERVLFKWSFLRGVAGDCRQTTCTAKALATRGTEALDSPLHYNNVPDAIRLFSST